MGLLDDMVVLFLVFWETSTLFSASTYIPTNSVGEVLSLDLLQHVLSSTFKTQDLYGSFSAVLWSYFYRILRFPPLCLVFGHLHLWLSSVSNKAALLVGFLPRKYSLQEYGCSHIFAERSAATAKLLQSSPTLCDPIDGSPPGSPFPGILQARTLG